MNDPKNDIDIAWADSQSKYHWLHPAERNRNDPRLAAIRAKHRALHKAGQSMEKIAKKTDKLAARLDALGKP